MSRRKETTNSINILQWNTRSLIKNVPYLNQYLATNHFQALLLQSLNVNEPNLPELSGYYFPPVHEQTDPVSRIQTAIYIRKGLHYCIRTSPAPKTIASISSCAVMIKFPSSLILNVASIYMPKGPDNENSEWLREFQDEQERQRIVM